MDWWRRDMPLGACLEWMRERHPKHDIARVYLSGLEQLFEAYKDKKLAIAQRRFREKQMIV